MNRLKDAAYTIVFMLLICAFFVALVSTLYHVTSDRISLNEQAVLRKAVMQALDIPAPDDPEQIKRLFEKKVETVRAEDGSVRLYRGENNTEVFTVGGTGLWGPIKAVVSIGRDGKTVRGLAFLDHNETPGLGARIDEKWFTEQFKKGKKLPLSIVPEGAEDDKSEFDAITGATITSKAVRDMLNKLMK